MVRRVIVKNKIGAKTIRVGQGSGQLDQELPGGLNVGGWRRHVELATLDALAHRSVQSDCVEELEILRRIYSRGR